MRFPKKITWFPTGFPIKSPGFPQQTPHFNLPLPGANGFTPVLPSLCGALGAASGVATAPRPSSSHRRTVQLAVSQVDEVKEATAGGPGGGARGWCPGGARVDPKILIQSDPVLVASNDFFG